MRKVKGVRRMESRGLKDMVFIIHRTTIVKQEGDNEILVHKTFKANRIKE
jgi:hypothetical protein